MALNSNSAVLFDTPSKEGKIWSHHVLRIVFSLHYKGFPYSIEGIEYPDINSTFAPTTLTPKTDPIELYEIPVLKLHTLDRKSRYFMGTLDIIQVLEDIHPEAPLLYASPQSVEFRSRFGPAFAPIIQAVVGHVPKILSERSAESFAQKRLDRWGKSVAQWIAEHPLGDGLASAETGIKQFGDWLELSPGPFVNGDLPSYADFTVASMLAFVKAVGFPDMLQKLLKMHPAVERLYDGVKSTQLGNAQLQDLFC